MIVPVLGAELNNLISLVWVVLLVIGVISSIVTNLRKAVKSAQLRGPEARARLEQRMARVEPVEVPPPPVIVRAAPKPRPAAAVVPPKPPEADGTPPFRGMFERGSIVRAIVAAEVLGPPKALQEQSIWSPRHSEPSI